MIYGDPIFLGGGGGGEILPTDAILRVQAPAGSTVTITKGSTTKSDQGHANADDAMIYDYYFVIHASQFDSVTPWTVTATRSGMSSSATIIISVADEYNVALVYELWLIKDGAFVSSYETAIGGYAATITPGYNSECVQILSGMRSSSSSLMYFTPAISFPTPYQYLVCEYQVRGGHVTSRIPCFGVASVIPTVANPNNWSTKTWSVYSELTASASNTFTAKTTHYIDISNVSGDFWVGISEGGASSQTGEFLCYNLYLTNDPPTT